MTSDKGVNPNVVEEMYSEYVLETKTMEQDFCYSIIFIFFKSKIDILYIDKQLFAFI